ncbi:hypothetical protein HKCCE3408_08420 [Rhodobacterales bacterium HKCCE3408]|nr:hypothetical protein [Rhodobacterales bacterium HKCCE3408]
MMTADRSGRIRLGLPAGLMLGGQLLYVCSTLFHAGGHANHHGEIFTHYAGSETWTLVHVGQFMGVVLLVGGLTCLNLALEIAESHTSPVTRLGVVSAAAALALYGMLQAVDGVALKQSVSSWANAPAESREVRFAVAEGIRWLEWGARGYHDYAISLALMLTSVAGLMAHRLPRLFWFLIASSGVVFAIQGWICTTSGFTDFHSTLIVTGWCLNIIWMAWLAGLAVWARYAIAARYHGGITSAADLSGQTKAPAEDGRPIQVEHAPLQPIESATSR